MNVALNLGLDGSVIGSGIGAILLYAVLGVLLMLLGFYAVDLTTPGPLNRMVRAGGPTRCWSPRRAWWAWRSSWSWRSTPRPATCWTGCSRR